MNVFHIKLNNICLIRSTALCSLVFFQSCANSTVGEKLSESFDVDILKSKNTLIDRVSNSEDKSIEKKNKTEKVNKNKSNYIEEKSSNKLVDESFRPKNKLNINNSKFDKPRLNSNTIPYRIILILKNQDPSSPSENLIRALLREGIEFEVEKIEMVENKKTMLKKRSQF